MQDAHGRMLGQGLFTRITPDIPDESDDQLAKAVALQTDQSARELFNQLQEEVPEELKVMTARYIIAAITIVKL